jgi:hypothetical protein
MIKTYFFVGNTLIGSGLLPSEVQEKLGHVDRPHNRAYFCPACGDIWGRIYIRHEQDFSIRNRLCAEHGSGLFQDNSSPMWKHYPKEVLARELSLIAQHLNRNPHLEWESLVINWKRYYD